MKRMHKVKIIKKVEISKDVFKFEVERQPEMGDVLAGQFFNLSCGEGEYPLLKRPISVSLVNEKTIEFIIIRNGFGTALLNDRPVGTELSIMGPLGNGYTIEDNHKKVIVLGGGIGIAPQRELVKVLSEAGGREIDVMMGFRSTPYGLETYEKYADTVKLSTEDGTVGHKGYITDVMDEALATGAYDVIYACGPHLMLKAAFDVAKKHNTPIQLLMEERMACGIGACYVCTCKIKDDTKEEGYWNQRVCKDGPVFYGDEVLFDE